MSDLRLEMTFPYNQELRDLIDPVLDALWVLGSATVDEVADRLGVRPNSVYVAIRRNPHLFAARLDEGSLDDGGRDVVVFSLSKDGRRRLDGEVADV